MQLSALFIYPVKSLRGCSVSTCAIDSLGLVGDRRFMVVDESGRFLTQRVIPKMALVDTTLTASAVTLSIPGQGSVTVLRTSEGDACIRDVSVWSSTGLSADDCGSEAADWLSSALGTACRLVRIGDQYRRAVIQSGGATDDLVSFADAFPFLILGESSLADLNDRLVAHVGDPLSMSRFRPNLVFSGGEPFAEDHWNRFRVGNVIFRTGGPCARCTITTIDPDTSERGPEPLRTLATYRRNPGKLSEISFGQNLVHETKSGVLRVGDPIGPLG